MTSFWVKIRDAVEHECEALQNILAPIEAELKPIIEADLKAVAEAGLAAGLAFLTHGGSLTLNAAEGALVVGSRAALAMANQKGIQLTAEGAAALMGGATLASKPILNK